MIGGLSGFISAPLLRLLRRLLLILGRDVQAFFVRVVLE